jgi:hypothetical protein
VKEAAVAVKGYVGPVEVVALRDWQRGERSGRYIKFREPGQDAATALELPLAKELNGDAPRPGEVVNLVLDVYPWHDARLNAEGKPFPVVDTKVRVVGAQKAA